LAHYRGTYLHGTCLRGSAYENEGPIDACLISRTYSRDTIVDYLDAISRNLAQGRTSVLASPAAYLAMLFIYLLLGLALAAEVLRLRRSSGKEDQWTPVPWNAPDGQTAHLAIGLSMSYNGWQQVFPLSWAGYTGFALRCPG
jgi:hypothetical protein